MIYMKLPTCQKSKQHLYTHSLLYFTHCTWPSEPVESDAAVYLRHLLLYKRINVISWPAIFYLYCSVPFCGDLQLTKQCSNGNKGKHCVWTRSELGANMSKPEDSMDTGDTGENSVRFVPFFIVKCCLVAKYLRQCIFLWTVKSNDLEKSETWLLRSYCMIWGFLNYNDSEVRFVSLTAI